MLVNRLQGWDLSSGPLTPQPVFLQGPELPLSLKNSLELSLPLSSSPQRILQISQGTRAVLPAWA